MNQNQMNKHVFAVDLDGTLAQYTDWGGPETIGPPVPAMLQRVKEWLQDGQDVVVFTARVSADQDPFDAATARAAIRAWLIKYLGQELLITADKSMHFAEMWDDRGVQVASNEGVKICEAPTPLELRDNFQAEPPLNLKDKTVLIVDTGLFGHAAERLATQFGKVLIHNPTWKEAFSTSKKLYIGDGLHGVTRVDNLWEHVKDADLIVFPDIQHGDLQEELIRQGKRVWGSRMAQDLEMDRWGFRELLQELDMPVAPAERIIGVDALTKLLEKSGERFVKISTTRGDGETFHHTDQVITRGRLNEWRHTLGPLANDTEFIVEERIETDLEMGGDHPFVGDWPSTCAWGYELKDVGFLANICAFKNMPEPIQWCDGKMAPVLREFGYAGNFSTEIRVKGKKYYLIDPTCRAGSPPSQVFWEMIGNWGEIMWHGAVGKVVEPIVNAPYGVLAMVYSERCDKEWLAYKYPEKLVRQFKFSFSCIVDNVRYTIPQQCGMSAMACVVATGESPMEAITKLKEYASQLQGDGLDIRLDAIPKGIAEIHTAEKFGYKFGSAKVPTVEQVAKLLI